MKCTMDNGSISKSAKKRIVILGGGFGGVHAALHLERLLAREPEVEICLVSRDNFFLFTPMLHEIAASDLEITNIVNPLRKLLRRVKVFVGEVERIDLPKKRVVISHGHHNYDNHSHRLEYDHLVLALGSITKFFNLPGLAEQALSMKSLPDAIQLRARIIRSLEEANSECSLGDRQSLLAVVVAGGGFAGVESVAAVNEFLQIPGWSGVWAVGDCAFVSDVRQPGKSHPPTAQHAIREGRVAAQNIALALKGRPPKAFSFRTIGLLASIGRRTGVARILGFNFSGFFAWWLWRTIYLSKLPGLDKKVRVGFD